MPSGKTHAAATVIAAGIASPAIAMVARQPATSALAFATGCLVGLVVTPDLDVRHWDTHSETIVRRSGGCFVGAMWNLIWIPYAYLIPRHRHPLSHWPILGTLLRLLYLAALPGLCWWILNWIVPLPEWTSSFPIGPLVWWALAGLLLVDTLHAVMDWIF
jgi:uncharacterized metal-binding protein